MTRSGAKPVLRCGLYTRKSSEEGLDQSFNSLHAQREACEAYVKSQAAEGWRAVKDAYDDGGFSGGNLERPGLKRLLADIAAGKVDVVVVYKIDRLTRSLMDFAKIVEAFDATGVSFVSVTQAFNTTSSMGRLTLNVLLSFAQFEREVTGERIRDKLAASKRKGMWMGGVPPLGYDPPVDPTTRALVVNPAEAERVRHIFGRYLEVGSVSALEANLAADGIRSKAWTSRSGKAVGGCQINRGALFHMLRNRLYRGEIPHGKAYFPGAHQPIVDEALFEQVQARLDAQRRARIQAPTRAASAPLTGRLFDTDGSAMSPVFTRNRRGRLYRYYVSTPLQLGRSVDGAPDTLRRINAAAVEGVVAAALAPLLVQSYDATSAGLATVVRRVDVDTKGLRITLIRTALRRSAEGLELHASDPTLGVLILPFAWKRRGGRTHLVLPHGADPSAPQRDPVLIRALRRAHGYAAALGWRGADGQLTNLTATAPSNPYHRKLTRLAFLSPRLQQAILDGRQPVGLTLERLVHQPIPPAWSEQERLYAAL